jgi:hypothetical protein
MGDEENGRFSLREMGDEENVTDVYSATKVDSYCPSKGSPTFIWLPRRLSIDGRGVFAGEASGFCLLMWMNLCLH